MLFSKLAKANGASGFFFDDDKNAPNDVIEVSNVDAELAVGLTAGSAYDFGDDGRLIVTTAPAPTSDELLNTKMERLKLFRAAAFAAEADPLFFKWQRGEATESDWKVKVAEIRARFPYPGE